MRDEHGEIFQTFLRGLKHGHSCRGCGGFKTDAQENNFLRRILFRELHRIERRINDAHVAAASFDRKQIRHAAGHAKHVAKRSENHLGSRGDFQRLVYDFQRRHTNRTTRPVDESDLLRQQFINAEFDDRVRLPAADFHDVPWSCRDAVDFACELLREFRIAIFVEEFHGPASFNSSSSSICFKYSNTFCASSSSTRLNAKPAWTMT